MQLRLSLKAVLLLEVALSLLFLLVLVVAPGLGFASYAAAMLLLALVLQSLIIPFKGLDFVLWDEAPGSGWKQYWLLVIFLAAFLAGSLQDHLLELSQTIRSRLLE